LYMYIYVYISIYIYTEYMNTNNEERRLGDLSGSDTLVVPLFYSKRWAPNCQLLILVIKLLCYYWWGEGFWRVRLNLLHLVESTVL
jgi:hypothetical protein